MASSAQFIERDSYEEALRKVFRAINRTADAINVVPTTVHEDVKFVNPILFM